MGDNVQQDIGELIDLAILGDKRALENLLLSVQDLVFNLSLRMLGTVNDAEDATQEIMIKVMTHLSTFRKESAFSTWAFCFC
jgi:RNA polymerase sigma factor (sigma-70 family)